MTFSLLVTQVGYGPDDPKPFFVRAALATDGEPEVRLVDTLSGEVGPPLGLGPAAAVWGALLWRGELVDLRTPGRYQLELAGGTRSNEFTIEENVLVDRTLVPCAVENLQARIGGKLGWQDCAFDGRGLESHAITILGLVDVLWLVSDVGPDLGLRLREQLRHGTEYLLACQRPDGSFMNEYYIGRDLTVWTLCGLACVALARAAELLSNGHYLEAAKLGWTWLRDNQSGSADSSASELAATRRIYGQYAPWHPPQQPRARDMLLMLRAATELYRNTNDLGYAAEAFAIALTIRRDYQVSPSEGGGLYGHFRAWPNGPSLQPAWEHTGWGFNCGAVLPDDVSGFVALLELFPDSEDADSWRATLWDYASGYLIPATAGTPFGIYPVGEFEGTLRYFSPAWHGFNGVYGQVARTCMMLARLFGDQSLERVAHSNLQWIAGLNFGTEIEQGLFGGLSWINGIGTLSAEAWSGIPGSIGNGFSATPQFHLEHVDDVTDSPAYQTNEDWLVHLGSWLTGLAHVQVDAGLKVRVAEDGVGVAASVRVRIGDLDARLVADSRGVAFLDQLPRMTTGTVTVTWAGHTVERTIAPVSGTRTFLNIDVGASLILDQGEDGVVLIRNDGERSVDATVSIYTRAGVTATDHTIGPDAVLSVQIPAGPQDWFRLVAATPTTEVALESALTLRPPAPPA